MNPLTNDERYAMYCDLIAGLIGGLILLVFLWYRDIGPTLLDNPCAPGHKVTIDRVHVGCTNDEQSPRLWRSTP